jgi:hypothetical protein
MSQDQASSYREKEGGGGSRTIVDEDVSLGRSGHREVGEVLRDPFVVDGWRVWDTRMSDCPLAQASKRD